jgi:hypothetical protein
LGSSQQSSKTEVSIKRWKHLGQLSGYKLLNLFTNMWLDFAVSSSGYIISNERINNDFEKMWCEVVVA